MRQLRLTRRWIVARCRQSCRISADTSGSTKVRAADHGLAAGITLTRDVGTPEKFTDVTEDSYSKSRLGIGPTNFYEAQPATNGDKADLDNNTDHVAGDACISGTPARAPSRRWSTTA